MFARPSPVLKIIHLAQAETSIGFYIVRGFASRGFQWCRSTSAHSTHRASTPRRCHSTLRGHSSSFQADFYRGGTSNGLLIRREQLPGDQEQWGPILAGAMGSPDSYGRQLNGMGSGISSTSKVCVISKSGREDVDVDYTFVQVGIKDGSLDFAGNCGNMSSAVGPFALGRFGLWKASTQAEDTSGKYTTLRIYNTNTNKIIESTFKISKSRKEPETFNYDHTGDYSIDGVPGTGSRITLSFLNPGGSKTGLTLPTGQPIDTLTLPDSSTIQASLIDIANPGVFINATDLNISGTISPDTLASNAPLMDRLEQIRQAGAQTMGLDPNIQSIPKIVIVSPPSHDSEAHITCRALSMQQAHKAVPLTLALNLGAACHIKGTIPEKMARKGQPERVVVEHASGKVEVGCTIDETNGEVKSAVLHRTARMLMRGNVYWR